MANKRKLLQQQHSDSQDVDTVREMAKQADDAIFPSALDFNLPNMQAAKDMIRADGIQIGAYHLTRKGLEIKGDTSESDWHKVGSLLFALEGKIQLLIGDYLVHSETVWGKTYQQLATVFGRDVNTLYQYHWVSGAVEFSLRRENLGYSHYKEVAGFDAESKAYWITEASENEMSVRQFRAAIKAWRDEDKLPPVIDEQIKSYTRHINRLITDDAIPLERKIQLLNDALSELIN